MSDEQIKEVMRLGDVIENLAWSAGKTEQYHDEPTDYAEKLPAARAELETYLRTIGEPAGYSLPAGSIGAKKFAQVGGGFTPVGLVFSRGESAMAITEHGRVYWDRDLVHPISGEPESVNAELLEALKESVKSLAGYRREMHCGQPCDAERLATEAIARAESAIETPAKVSPARAAPASTLKPHVFRELVNDLRDLAKEFHGHDSLRDRISGRLAQDVPVVGPCQGHAVQHDRGARRV